MKVLVYRYNSICEPDVISAFGELGISVITFDKEMYEKDYKPEVAVAELGAFLQDNPVDFVFSINFFPYLAEVCNIFHLKYLCWIVDSPVMELYSTAISREYNRVFIFDRALFNEISPLNPGNVFHLPLAANIREKEKLFSNTSRAIKDKFSHEVAFVGSLYTEKCPYDKAKNIPDKTRGYLEGIIAAQQMVYGYYFIEEILSDEIVSGFKDCVDDFFELPDGSFLTDKRTLAQQYIGYKVTANERVETFKRLAAEYNVSIYTASDTSKIKGIHNMGRAKTLTEMPIIFNQSKINLNPTSKVIRTGLPLRIFDILSCEGFLISNYQEEIPELFVSGEDLVVYSSLEELSYLVGYYLDHENERKEIAKNGFNRLKENYTYEIQLGKMLLKAFA